jgi:predicted RNase H-like nuclease (RuvC/YqgF family)
MSTIGSRIDQLFTLREKRRELEKKVDENKKQAELLELELMELMDKEGIEKSSGKNASVSITENTKPNVENWDTFYQYIHRTKAYFLLERRPSVTACRELFETKGKIPGVVPFVKRSINLRTRD